LTTLLAGRKVVLAGDHLQLPPTVMSDEAARDGLSETLFARVHAKWHAEGVVGALYTSHSFCLGFRVFGFRVSHRLKAPSSTPEMQFHGFAQSLLL
jgi:hypothetical protein